MPKKARIITHFYAALIKCHSGTIAISGETIVIGAPREASSATGMNGDESIDDLPYSGAAYVFVREGTNWIQQAYLKSVEAKSGLLGYGVAISGNVIAATGFDWFGSGQATTDVYLRNGETWRTHAYLYEGGVSTAISDEAIFAGSVKIYSGLVPPRLSISRSPGGVRFSWPLAASGFALHEANELRTGQADSWSVSALPLQTNETETFVNAPPQLGLKFYRLRKD